MKIRSLISKIILFMLLTAVAGCKNIPTAYEILHLKDQTYIYAKYRPVKIIIMPLTEVVGSTDGHDDSKLKIYVSLVDSFASQIKAPGVFRFELYELVLRSAKPKGRRVHIWPDIDLTELDENNEYWRDFLRAYEFNLDFEPSGNQSYILQVTSQATDGRRLSAEFTLKPTK